MSVDPRSPCLIGVAARTWRPDAVGPDGAPEPLAMWEQVVREAATDTGRSGVLGAVDSLQVVYCQTAQYDDPVGRLADRLGIDPRHRHYSGIGGTTTQQLVGATAERMVAGDLDLAVVASAEALATQRAWKRRGERFPYSYRPAERRPYPWEAPFDPAEVAHEVFQAWLTFAVFDHARRAALGATPAEYGAAIGRMLAPLSEVAAVNPLAWFPVARSADEIATPTPANRMVATPYPKYSVAVMDVDMAAAIVLATHERADALGVPPERRVYLRGSAYATDPVVVAAHPDLAGSPAMRWAAERALGAAGADIDDIAHLDLYSCFASSLHFATDALGIDPGDSRGLTVTGGLPYHGSPASGYLTHSLAAMARRLREDPGALGLVSGVGMHMTKHVYGVWSTEPGTYRPIGPAPEPDAVPVIAVAEGEAAVAAYSVVYGRDGAPEWTLLVCDLAGGARTYGRIEDPGVGAVAASEEFVGRRVRLRTVERTGPAGPVRVNLADPV